MFNKKLMIVSMACIFNVYADNLTITNGTDVPQGKYPFFAAIDLETRPVDQKFGDCGGALIASNWVITAKHCMINYYPDIGYGAKVAIGSSNLSESGTYQVAKVIKTFYYNTTPTISGNDIALIKLDKNITYKPINFIDHDLSIDESATVIGHGTVAPQVAHSIILQEVQIPIDDNYYCNKLNIVTDKELCAGTTSGLRKNAALGDSGGPLFQTVNGEYFLAGIVSRGVYDWETPLASVYTNVYSFRTWIESIVHNN